jgi:phage antirepressor YoqD-like protein
MSTSLTQSVSQSMQAVMSEFEGCRFIIRGETFDVVAKDVVEKVFGQTWNGPKRVAHIPDEWKGATSVVTPGGPQEMITLSEQGLYFACARSDSPKALPFQMRVAEMVKAKRLAKVIPVAPPSLEEMALTVITGMQAKIADQKAIIAEQQAKLAVFVPKAMAHDIYAGTTGLIGLTKAAKQLEMSPHALVDKLKADGWLYKLGGTLVPKQRYIDNGMMALKRVPADNPKYEQSFLTCKGLAKLADALVIQPAQLRLPLDAESTNWSLDYEDNH